jgi:Holliday junction resolvasome RuvABC DNA-binding subunit
MIAFLKGRLVHKEPAFVIIDVNGVGYQVNISLATYGQIKRTSSCLLTSRFEKMPMFFTDSPKNLKRNSFSI